MSKELPDGATSVRAGAAVLRPIDEPGHFGLFRPVVLVRRDGDAQSREELGKELGPLAVYRVRGKGDAAPEAVGSIPGIIRTHDPSSNKPLELMLVWWPTGDEMKKEFEP